jgi:hypothetical protein
MPHKSLISAIEKGTQRCKHGQRDASRDKQQHGVEKPSSQLDAGKRGAVALG